MNHTRRLVVVLAAVMVLAAASWTPAAAQVAQATQVPQALQNAMARAQRVADIQADKAGFVEQVLNRWGADAVSRGYDAFFEKGTRKLMKKSAADLLDLSQVKDFDTFYKLVFLGYTVNAFGNLTQDLVYYPINACRLYDSRTATGGLAGAMAPGTERSISVNDSTGIQGGASPDCDIVYPDLDDDPPALAVTITAVTPTGAGNLRTFAAGDPVPQAAMVTYTAGTTISTGVITSSCTSCGAELTIRNQGAGNVNVVVDLVGYFHAPKQQPLGTQVVTASQANTAVDTGWNLAPACPAGTSLVGGGEDTSYVSFPGGVTGTLVHFENGPSGTAWNCRGWNRTNFSLNLVTCSAICARIPGR